MRDKIDFVLGFPIPSTLFLIASITFSYILTSYAIISLFYSSALITSNTTNILILFTVRE